MRFFKMTKDLQYFLIMNNAQYEKMKKNSMEFENALDQSTSQIKKKVDAGTIATSLRGYEQKIKVSDLVKLVIPELTRDIVRIQKNIKSNLQGEGVLASKDAKFGRFVHKSKQYTEAQILKLAQESTDYPFTILFNNYELNIVATSYADYRDITKAVLCLMNQNLKSTPNQPNSGLKSTLVKQAKRISLFPKP